MTIFWAHKQETLSKDALALLEGSAGKVCTILSNFIIVFLKKINKNH